MLERLLARGGDVRVLLRDASGVHAACLTCPRRDAAEAGAGSKWTLTAFAEWMARQGHGFEALWGQVGGAVGAFVREVCGLLWVAASVDTRSALTCPGMPTVHGRS